MNVLTRRTMLLSGVGAALASCSSRKEIPNERRRRYAFSVVFHGIGAIYLNETLHGTSVVKICIPNADSTHKYKIGSLRKLNDLKGGDYQLLNDSSSTDSSCAPRDATNNLLLRPLRPGDLAPQNPLITIYLPRPACICGLRIVPSGGKPLFAGPAVNLYKIYPVKFPVVYAFAYATATNLRVVDLSTSQPVWSPSGPVSNLMVHAEPEKCPQDGKSHLGYVTTMLGMKISDLDFDLKNPVFKSTYSAPITSTDCNVSEDEQKSLYEDASCPARKGDRGGHPINCGAALIL